MTGVKRASMLAICIAGLIGCSDDGGKDRTLPDGAMAGDSGQNALDGGLDGSLVTRDATVLPDGRVIDQASDSGNPTNGEDATVALPCGGSCNDNIDCTIDTCLNNKCEHRVDDNACMPGSSCNLTMGCQQGIACSMNAQCADMDNCTVNERCNTMVGRCEHDILDRDGDGYPPASCGGTDCDDNRGTVNPSAKESCNGRDDDCDGTVDDNLTPVAGYVCTGGKVECAQAYRNCGNAQNPICVDTKTSEISCGSCLNPCSSGETCEAGECKCSASGTVCGTGMNTSCEDTSKSVTDCGGCGMPCYPVIAGGQFQSCMNSSCLACGGENQPCCSAGPTGCGLGLSCNGTQGTATSKCECGAGSAKCGAGCVDLTSDEANCGACGKRCTQTQACITKNGATACETCGGVGEPCCGGLLTCRANGLTCGPDNTCVIANASSPMGPGGANGQ